MTAVFPPDTEQRFDALLELTYPIEIEDIVDEYGATAQQISRILRDQARARQRSTSAIARFGTTLIWLMVGIVLGIDIFRPDMNGNAMLSIGLLLTAFMVFGRSLVGTRPRVLVGYLTQGRIFVDRQIVRFYPASLEIVSPHTRQIYDRRLLSLFVENSQCLILFIEVYRVVAFPKRVLDKSAIDALRNILTGWGVEQAKPLPERGQPLPTRLIITILLIFGFLLALSPNMWAYIAAGISRIAR